MRRPGAVVEALTIAASHSALNYRPELDGLRAIAVLSVILYHARMPGVNGGYIGVSIFFVLSGFLIGRIIFEERKTQSFSYAAFYDRRIRRLFPALSVVLATTLIAGFLLLVPTDFRDVGLATTAATLFVSNVLFYWKTGYFQPDAQSTVLLHTWSLAIEEQFYILFPLLAGLIGYFTRRTAIILLAGAILASLALSEIASVKLPTANFYFLPFRAWELLSGSFIAYLAVHRPETLKMPKPRREGLTCVGLLAIIAAIVLFDEHTRTPSLVSALPIVGTGLIVAYGEPDTLVGKLLSVPVLVGIGLLSYSAYLWHYPLFAYVHLDPDAPLARVGAGGLIAITFALSFLSWRFVERPFRNRKFLTRSTIFGSWAAGSAVFVVAGLWVFGSSGVVARLTPDQAAVLALSDYQHASSYRTGRCLITDDQTQLDFGAECLRDLESRPGTVLVWGDSHAASLHVGLFNELGEMPKSQLTTSGCPPVLLIKGNHKHCGEINAWVMEKIRAAEQPHVVLAAFWWNYRSGDRDAVAALPNTIRALQDVGATVAIIGPLPRYSPNLPKAVLRKMLRGKAALADLEREMPSRDLPILRDIDSHLRAIAERFGAAYVSPVSRLCGAAACEAIIPGGNGLTLTTWDDSHLTAEGSRYLGSYLATGIRAPK